LLLDDELPGLMYLKMLCEQIPGLEVVKAFNSPLVFLKEATALDFDLCILDIEMPEANGLHIANLLNGKPVIFTTAYKEYAAEAFDLNAIDYVTKPVQKERLQKAIDKAFARIKTAPPEKTFIQLNTDQGKSLLFFDQLNYIKTSAVDSRDKQAFLASGQSLVLKNISFEKLIELLPRGRFCQINKQEMIALRIVQSFSHDSIVSNQVLETGKPFVLNLSDAYRKGFVESLNL
jgi:DNA-binding LytR/AlgR family response regulator